VTVEPVHLAPPRRLVVRLPTPLGDAVMATPALRALRAALPRTWIAWAGGPAALAVLEGLSWRDGVMPLAGPLAKGTLAPFRAARMLRRLEADATLLLPNSWSSAIAARLSRAPVRVGSTLRGRGVLLTHPVDLPLGEDGRLLPRPMRRHYLDLVAPFGAVDDGRGTELATTPFDEAEADRRLAGVPKGTRLLGVNPGAAFGPTKLYPSARLGDAVRAVRERRGVLPIVFCGPGEEVLGRETALDVGEPVVSTHERPPSLGELKALLERCALLMTTDAGPRHVAEALGVPTVVWMGPTDPRWSEGGPATVLRNEELACLGCHLTACPIGHPCMEKLPASRLVEACLAAIPA
jgi:heptosyltransferase-2